MNDRVRQELDELYAEANRPSASMPSMNLQRSSAIGPGYG